MLRTLGVVGLLGSIAGIVLSASCLFTVANTVDAPTFFAALGEMSPLLLAVCALPAGAPLTGIFLSGIMLTLMSN